MKHFALTTAMILGVSIPAYAQKTDAKLTQRLEAAHAVLHELMSTPDKGVPLDIAAKAQCVAVVPGFKKGAFVFGGEYGQGVATRRNANG